MMDKKQIEAFIAVVTTGGMTSAARLLDMSQPSITRMIQDLEKTLGFQLIHRNGPRISVTRKGLMFVREAENLLAAFQRAATRASDIQQDRSSSYSIATISAVGNSIIPRALGRLGAEQLPDRMRISVLSAEDVEQSVLSRQADVGFSNPPLDHPGLDVLGLYSAPCVMAVARAHPLAGAGRVSIKEMEGRTLVTMGSQFRFRRLVVEAFAEHGVKTGKEIICSSMITALEVVKEDLGMAIVEPLTAFQGPSRDVAIIPLEEEVRFYWGAIASTGTSMDSDLIGLIEIHEAVAVEHVPGFTKHS
jgi:DNA-binding transcriptional LysR family regulator